ncbi:MAG: FkbM family methyltransferase [Candidatus Bathyarchaeota archaeon]|nr:FkbM family methyltransferase [Candidatus Bathyarchaeota archaeon]
MMKGKKTILFIVQNLDSLPAIMFVFVPYVIVRLKEAMIKKEKDKRTKFHSFLYEVLHKKYHVPLVLLFKLEVASFQDEKQHEPIVSKFLSRTKGKLFVDIGANLGRYTILLSKNYERVIAIEPEGNNMWFLKQNVKHAKVNNVTFQQCAVSDEDGEAFLYFGSHVGEHSIFRKQQFGGVKVQTRKLSSIIRDEQVDLIKMDVEGAEWSVLKGSEEILDRIRSWVIELHDVNRKKELEDWFADRGYSFKWLDDIHIYAFRC